VISPAGPFIRNVGIVVAGGKFGDTAQSQYGNRSVWAADLYVSAAVPEYWLAIVSAWLWRVC